MQKSNKKLLILADLPTQSLIKPQIDKLASTFTQTTSFCL